MSGKLHCFGLPKLVTGRNLLPALLPALLLTLQCDLFAQTTTLRANAVAEPGNVIPVKVMVQHSGSDFKGYLEIVQKRDWDSNSEVSHRSYIDVIGGVENEYTILYPPKPFPTSDSPSITLKTTNGKVVARAGVSFNTLDAGQLYSVMVGETAGELSVWSQTEVPGILDHRRTRIDQAAFGMMPGMMHPPFGHRPVAPPASSLRLERLQTFDSKKAPDHPAVFSNATFVMLSGLSVREASPETLSALKQYAAMGGVLVVHGAVDTARLQADFYKDILPGEVVGATEMSIPGIASPVFNTRFRPSADAVVLARVNGENVLYGVPYGNGAVLFLTLDASSSGLRSWNGYRDLTKQVITAAVDLNSQYPNALVNNVWGSDHTKATPPSVALIGLFLAAYALAATPLGLQYMRKKESLVLKWSTIPLIALFFSGIAWFAGFQVNSRSQIFEEVSLVQIRQGQSVGTNLSRISLVSPGEREFRIELPEQSIILPAVHHAPPTSTTRSMYHGYQDPSEGSPSSIKIEATGRTTEAVFQSGSWQPSTAVIRTPFESSGSVIIEQTSKGFKVSNNTEYNLESPLYFFLDGLFYRVPQSFRPGESKEISFEDSHFQNVGIENDFLENGYWPLLFYRIQQGSIENALAAKINKPVSPVKVRSRIRSERTSVLMVQFSSKRSLRSRRFPMPYPSGLLTSQGEGTILQKGAFVIKEAITGTRLTPTGYTGVRIELDGHAAPQGGRPPMPPGAMAPPGSPPLTSSPPNTSQTEGGELVRVQIMNWNTGQWDVLGKERISHNPAHISSSGRVRAKVIALQDMGFSRFEFYAADRESD